jgi:hypothetical protein
MPAALAVIADKDARDYCVVVVKGTFVTGDGGPMHLAHEQDPFVYADQHYGDPETTSIRLESDFALDKPFTDVVVVGKAMAPGGSATPELVVRLEVEGRAKDAVIVGERRWVAAAGSLVTTRPLPFTEMPLVFERAFGGVDDTRGPDSTASETRNLVGVGFHPHRSARAIHDTALPNIEHPMDRSEPIGFGFVGRAWHPRSTFAGTYDQRWLETVCPFLPEDFDPRYNQGAPLDQQFPHFRGGEVLRCVHMAAQAVVTYVIPKIEVPVRFVFHDREVERAAILDTVVLEPHRGRAVLDWRARTVLGKKNDDLREIHVGALPPLDGDHLGYRRGKPAFRGIAATIRWLNRGRRR